ncbi:hypothetical protein [Actinoplanes philippinensis]|uniref:hypothetical protein n=1 Tax=Actinoplanes philippinensis TaxID=35752 RepID=UPI0033EA3CE0
MTATTPAEIVGEHRVTVNIPDLDQGFRLKTRSMLALAVPMMYDSFTRHVDVAALRAAGYGSVVTHAEFERRPGPLAVGADLDVTVVTRHAELSGQGLGVRSSRLGFECRYTFASRPGTGDPFRYRETVSDEPFTCGTARLLLTLIRRDGPPGRRIVAEPLPQTRHLAVHVLDPAHPRAADVAQPPDDAVEVAAGERSGVFGPQHTDTNQIVFTGEYLTLLEDHLTVLLAQAGEPAGDRAAERVTLSFRNPFRAGDTFTTRGRLWRDGTAVLGVHADGADEPHVLGRLDCVL